MQRDFILRMIEQMGAALIALRKLILGGGDVETIRASLTSASQQLGLDITLLRGLDLDSLGLFISPGGELEPTRAWLTAEVMYLDGLHAARDGRPDDALESFRKARALYDMVRPMGGMIIGFPEATERIAEIDGEVAALDG